MNEAVREAYAHLGEAAERRDVTAAGRDYGLYVQQMARWLMRLEA